MVFPFNGLPVDIPHQIAEVWRYQRVSSQCLTSVQSHVTKWILFLRPCQAGSLTAFSCMWTTTLPLKSACRQALFAPIRCYMRRLRANKNSKTVKAYALVDETNLHVCIRVENIDEVYSFPLAQLDVNNFSS